MAVQADLKELLVEFGETIAEKQADIEKEQELLAQMQVNARCFKYVVGARAPCRFPTADLPRQAFRKL